MDLITKDLLINFLFILLSLFLVQMFYLLKYAYRFEELKDWMIAVFPVVSVVLCMLFPVALGEHFILDLRRIPFILGTLYGGYKLGFFLLSLILIIRYPMGGDGFYVTLLSLSLVVVLVFFLSKYYLKMSVKQKLMVSGSLIFVSLMTSMFFSEQILGLNIGTTIWIEYIVINVIGMFITTILWEVIRTNFDVLQRVIKAEKLEVVSHLATSISHEVRNPLTASRGFVQMLSEDVSLQTRKKYVDIAIQELDRAAEIINDYLTFAKPILEKKEKINVFEEIQHAVSVITPLANMNTVRIRLSLLNNEKYFVVGERKKFQQCLINMLKNGIEAMPDGGELQILLSYNHPNIQIDICDTGKGMTQEQMNRLGEPYFTTKEKGTGLGTMVSFSIIKGMNGKISVASEEGKGTYFSIKIPIYQHSAYINPHTSLNMSKKRSHV
ncbi:ATP-binding protein [Bacillus songklensis]|uniref:histidine kinase n=1 Tax=Bacillus songklensis TaxID=1069116 RepID=A0ABV8AW95_9BACI